MSCVIVSLILSLICDLSRSSAGGTVIYVSNNASANDTGNCRRGLIPCKTLSYALEGVSSNTSVDIDTGIYPLTGSNTVENITDISIQGSHNTTLQCTQSAPSGLAFVNCSRITLAKFRVEKCGIFRNSTTLFRNSNTTAKTMVAIYVSACRDLVVRQVDIVWTNGTGMQMFTVLGNVLVEWSNFSHNLIKGMALSGGGGGGLYIEFPYCPPGTIEGPLCGAAVSSNAAYIIRHCYFSGNNASVSDPSVDSFTVENQTSHVAFGRGGGLSLFFAGAAYNNSVLVENCTFVANTAVWGGGLFGQFQDMAKGNQLVVRQSHFYSNSLPFNTNENTGTGGGACRVGFVFYEPNTVQYNSVSFKGCTFNDNRAYWGGGVSFYVARETNQVIATNQIDFYDCSWISNIARLGSAVELSVYYPIITGALPTAVFNNCSFARNTNNYHLHGGFTSLTWQYIIGRGTVYSDSIPLEFQTNVLFQTSVGSALSIVNSFVKFSENCSSIFKSNEAIEGGAISLLGDSFMLLDRDTHFCFYGNKAYRVGGAIYAISIGGQDLVSSRNCFLRYIDFEAVQSDWKVKIEFVNNSATVSGNSIYTTSLLPCLWGKVNGQLNTSSEVMKRVFRWPGVFEYNDCASGDFACSQYEISTDLSDVVRNDSTMISSDATSLPVVSMFPGKFTALPFDLYDDIHNPVQTVFFARVDCEDRLDLFCSSTKLNEATVYTSHLIVSLSGQPVGYHAPHTSLPTLRLNSLNSLEFQVTAKVRLLCCPAGFYLDNKDLTCECANSPGTDNHLKGIIGCDEEEMLAIIKSNFWIGYFDTTGNYVTNISCKDAVQLTSVCPPQYCKTVSSEGKSLPKLVSNEKLSGVLCANREGVLCGQCRPNYSIAINSFGISTECIQCSQSYSLTYAWLIWVMSELAPVTLVLLAFLVFDFKMLSGPMNAFILYAQVTEYFGLVDFMPEKSIFVKLYNCLYSFWNLKFLGGFLHSYCLVEGLTTFTHFLVEYGIAIYPLFLLLLFLILKKCCCTVGPCSRLTRKIQYCFIRYQRLWKTKSNILNGLATFMVLTYSKITITSFTILATAKLQGMDNQHSVIVVRYWGSQRLFDPSHLPYGILSIVMILTIVMFPPLVLIAYPIWQWLIGRYRLTRFTCIACLDQWGTRYLANGILPVFQGCYKDQFRFFAGFLFLFRIAFFAAYAFAYNTETRFTWNATISLVALLLHSVFQPYNSMWINVLDSFIYSIMVVVNVISLFMVYGVLESGDLNDAAFIVQTLLVYMPLFYFTGWVVFSLIRAFRKCYTSGRNIQKYRERLQSTTQASDAEVTQSGALGRRSRRGGSNAGLLQSTSDVPINSGDVARDRYGSFECSGTFSERQGLLQNKSSHSKKDYRAMEQQLSRSVTMSVVTVDD